jgi:hypothetical protein
MNYLLAVLLGIAGLLVLFWSKPLAKRFGHFTAERHAMTFGKFAHDLGWDDPDKKFNIFLHRSLVIGLGLFLLLMALHSWFGTIYTGSAIQANSILETGQ